MFVLKRHQIFLNLFTNFVCFSFCFYREAAVAEKEVEDVDAPKVVDEEEKVVVENGKSDEAEAAVATEAAPANGSTEAEPEVTSTPAVEVAEVVADEAKNGNSTGMYHSFIHSHLTDIFKLNFRSIRYGFASYVFIM